MYTTLNLPGDADTLHMLMQNMTHNGSIVLFMLDENAHHLVLMFAHTNDPTCAKEGSLIQEVHTKNWIIKWNLEKRNLEKQTCI